MFLGHFGLAFAAKRAAPSVSLGTLVAAANLLDLIWPPLVLAGMEQVRVEPGNTAFTPLNFVNYPYSHSLAMSAVWTIAAAALYWAWRRRLRDAVVVGTAVFSHWVLDFVSHRPDLPLAPGSTVRFGAGLWNSVPATILVEGLIFVAGLWLYANGRGLRRVWPLAAFLAGVYAVNVMGGPPPSGQVVAGLALSLWLLVLWAWWADPPKDAPASKPAPQGA